jgi:hypothetical protein
LALIIVQSLILRGPPLQQNKKLTFVSSSGGLQRFLASVLDKPVISPMLLSERNINKTEQYRKLLALPSIKEAYISLQNTAIP